MIIKNGPLRLCLDRKEVKVNDPGDGCPAMVEYEGAYGSFHASYNCAINEGVLSSDRNGDKRLTAQQIDWLVDQEDRLEKFLYNS
jgi:hypothetical protein